MGRDRTRRRSGSSPDARCLCIRARRMACTFNATMGPRSSQTAIQRSRPRAKWRFAEREAGGSCWCSQGGRPVIRRRWSSPRKARTECGPFARGGSCAWGVGSRAPSTSLGECMSNPLANYRKWRHERRRKRDQAQAEALEVAEGRTIRSYLPIGPEQSRQVDSRHVVTSSNAPTSRNWVRSVLVRPC